MDNKPNGHAKAPPKSPPPSEPEPETPASSPKPAIASASDGSLGAKEDPRDPAPQPPHAIRDLSESCVRFVQRGLGKPDLRLDYTAETLPLLDHYLSMARVTLGLVATERGEGAEEEGEGRGEEGEEREEGAEGEEGEERGGGRRREATRPRPTAPMPAEAAPATASLLAQTAGAYLGEVIRRRYNAWWRIEGSDPMGYRVELADVFLAISPMLLIAEGFERAGGSAGAAAIDAAKIEMDEEDRKAAAERLSVLEVDEDEYYAPSTRIEVIDILVDTIRARRLQAGDPPDMNLTPEDYEP